jgi:hypothetical protein
MDLIDRLREKPVKTKKRIAWAASASVTLIIFGVWMSVLHFGADRSNEQVTAAVANSSSADVNPFSAFWSVLSGGWDSLSNSINQIKTGIGDAKNMVKTLNATSSAVSAALSANEVLILSATSTEEGQITQ